jgi:hypothetical protein
MKSALGYIDMGERLENYVYNSGPQSDNFGATQQGRQAPPTVSKINFTVNKT